MTTVPTDAESRMEWNDRPAASRKPENRYRGMGPIRESLLYPYALSSGPLFYFFGGILERAEFLSTRRSTHMQGAF